MESAANRKSGYLPSLDGWRAVAIAAVVMTHDAAWHLGRYSNEAWKDLGFAGVNLFFAISGVLICTRILEDEAAVGVFRLKDFYVRRLFRIQPAALTYLAVLAVLIGAGVVHEGWHYWLGGLFLYRNFLFHSASEMAFAGYFTAHFWSLSVEEHFYIFLSVLLKLVKRYRAISLAAVLLALSTAGRIAVGHGWFVVGTSNRRTYWVIGELIWPALFAVLLRRELVLDAARRLLRPWVAFGCTAVVLGVAEALHSGVARVGTLVALRREFHSLLFCFSFWVIATMLHPRSWTTRLLELAPLRYAGRLSYSIYVWHLLFLGTIWPENHITWAPMVWVGARPWRYVGIVATAMLSYHLIEKPLIRAGHRMAPPATPGHRDLAVGG
jgi:peptidoglycan/LPS O-acetylase OafA/YrhL